MRSQTPDLASRTPAEYNLHVFACATAIVALLVAAGAAAPPTDARAFAPPSHLADHLARAESCPASVRYCVGISLHVGVDAGGPIRDAAWFAEQVATANRHFAALEVGFRVVEVSELPASELEVTTRAQRDALGAQRVVPGLVHVFLISRLEDVDAPGTEIRGVHWRLRRDVARRWILLSKISGSLVLAHELGHFFGLPHSGYPVSIMNKQERASPPVHARTFHPEEVEAMREGLPALTGPAGTLQVDSPPPPP